MALLVFAAPATPQPHTGPGAKDGTPATCDGKPLTHHLHRARVLLQQAYALERWDEGPKRSAIRAAQEHRRCIGIAKTRSAISEYRDKLAKRLDRHGDEQRALAAITPYPGPNGTRWAIPWSIISCESGGSWSAYNSSSGARGPYQFLGWPVPWPVRSEADKLAHHRMAADLWDGGAGRSHWVC